MEEQLPLQEVLQLTSIAQAQTSDLPVKEVHPVPLAALLTVAAAEEATMVEVGRIPQVVVVVPATPSTQ